MHRDKVDVALLFDERLRAVTVVHIPIDDQHALHTVFRACVVRADRHVAEETKPHRAIPERVMARRSYSAKASSWTVAEREVDSVEHCAGTGGRGGPRTFAHDSVGVETSAAPRDYPSNVFDVFRVVRERELIDGGVSRFEMQQTPE
jgi:hypothetical protein